MITNSNVKLGPLITQPELSVLRKQNGEESNVAVQWTAGPLTGNSVAQVRPARLGHTVAETAQLLSISTRSVHRLLARGLLRGSKALRKIIIPRAEIEKFLRDTTGEV
jgi:excisionase family DNA binding protein